MPRGPRLLNEALRLLERGWSIFPVGHDKKPLIKWARYQQRLPSESELRSWFAESDANIAVATGLISGVIVLDVDGEKGEEAIAGLHFPEGPVAQTGGGGYHYWFKHPGLDSGAEVRNFAGRMPGVDLRGDGGYVVVPPSLHESGANYRWIKDPGAGPPPEAPGWLRSLIQGEAEADPEREAGSKEGTAEGAGAWYLELLALGVDEGHRNDAIARLAGLYMGDPPRGFGMDEDTALYMLEAFNATKVRPPLPIEELETTVRSIARTAQRRRAGEEAVLREKGAGDREKREAAREALSQRLKMSVERVLKYRADPPIYAIQINGAYIRLGGISQLIERALFRKRIADGLGILINVGAKEWNKLAEWLLAAVEEIEVSAATEAGAFEAGLASYLEDHPISPELNGDWRILAWENQPFTDENGTLYVSLTAFRKYIQATLQEKVPSKDLALTARMLGLVPEGRNIKLSGKHTFRRVWRVPEKLAGKLLESQMEVTDE